MDKCRARLEEWLISEGGWLDEALERGEDGSYRIMELNYIWQGFMAAWNMLYLPPAPGKKEATERENKHIGSSFDDFMRIEELEAESKLLHEQADMNADFIRQYQAEVADLKKRLKDAEAKVPKWHLLDEEKPEPYKDVIAFAYEVGDICLSYLDDTGQIVFFDDTQDAYYEDLTTHWMYAPEFPDVSEIDAANEAFFNECMAEMRKAQEEE